VGCSEAVVINELKLRDVAGHSEVGGDVLCGTDAQSDAGILLCWSGLLRLLPAGFWRRSWFCHTNMAWPSSLLSA
jgi:hypothetical protein